MCVFGWQCPPALQESINEVSDSSSISSRSPTEVVTERSLVRLHRRVIRATQRYNCTRHQWRRLVNDTLELEDIVLNESSRHGFLRHSFEGNAASTALGRMLAHVWTPTVGENSHLSIKHD